MGCCGSKQCYDKDDEHTRLLNKHSTDSGPSIVVKKEQEFWDQVVHRTTQNLIDISSASSEPLQHQDIQARTEKYQGLVRQVTCSDTKPSSFNTPTDWNEPDYPQWLDQAMVDVDRALTRIKIEPKGDIVIPLAPPKSLHYS